jgi:hypothetical protein
MLAREARDFVRDILGQSSKVEFRKAERDKYFRINAWVIADGKNVSAVLILNVFAVPYDGGTKTKDWCAETTVEPQAIPESLPVTPLRERQSEPGVAVIFYPRFKRERESRRTLLGKFATYIDISRLIVWVGGRLRFSAPDFNPTPHGPNGPTKWWR